MSSDSKKYTIALLPGDGIGEEVCEQALRILNEVSLKGDISFEFQHAFVGGAAYEKFGSHFPDETLSICKNSDAILFGSVGGPVENSGEDKWKDCERNSILALRKAFGFNTNLRPAKVYPELIDICPLREDVALKGVDLLVVRELLGDVYFGEKSRETRSGKRYASDLAEYSEDQIASAAKAGFEAARKRRKKVTSVDKANVLETSRLWREVVKEVSASYPDIELEHMYVDNAAMQIIRDPSNFDVVVTSNLFGDILSDAAAVLPGSLGLGASASFNNDGFAMYEPQGGSAPDIAGKNIANPIAQILSAAMMLRYSFNLEKLAAAIEKSISKTLGAGHRTADIQTSGKDTSSTSFLTDKIIENLEI